MAEPLWQWDELSAAAGGREDGRPLKPITGFSIDTRTINPGDVFVALKDTRDGHEFVGQIVTLSVQAKNVRIVPEANRSGENAPSHRVFAGRVEIGAGWAKRSNEGRDYLGLKLDDPSFTAPIYANLFDDEDGDGYSLIWSRPNRRNGE